MFRLAAIVYILSATVLAGVAVTALLAADIFDRVMLVSGALSGAVIAIPAAWIIARQLYALTRR